MPRILQFSIHDLGPSMRLGTQAKSLLPLIISSLLAILLIGRCIRFALAPEEYAIQGIGDDTFYYQKLACNFLEGKGWSFDGETKTTGFHLLFAYFLALINLVFGCGSWRAGFLITGIIASLCIAAACFITLRLAGRYYGRPAALATGISFFSPVVMLQVTSLMESWMSILFSSVAIAHVFYENSKEGPHLLKISGFAFSIGALVTLARTDGLVFLATLLFSLLLPSWSRTRTIGGFCYDQKLAKSFSLLCGGISGIALVALHNIIFTGSASQSSAATKLYWSSIAGHSPLRIIELTTTLFSYSFSELAIIQMTQSAMAFAFTFMAIAVGYRAFQHWRYSGIKATGLGLIFSSALWLVTCIFFYSFNSQAIQPWYISQILIPSSILAGGLWGAFFSTRSSGLILAAFILSVVQSTKHIDYAPMVHQEGMLRAGRYLATHYKDKKLAAWNAGIISFFSGRDVVNIDGLVNNEILRQIKSQTLARYIRKKRIDILVDYEAMLTSPELRLRGGYSDGKLVNCLEKGEKLDQDSSRWADSELFVFKVKPNCL